MRGVEVLQTQKAPEQRIFQVCKIVPETEQHFILSYPVYINFRKILFMEIRARCLSGYEPCRKIKNFIKLSGSVYHKKCYEVYLLCPQKETRCFR